MQNIVDSNNAPLSTASFWSRVNAYGYDILIVQGMALVPMYWFFSFPTLEQFVRLDAAVDRWFTAFGVLSALLFVAYNAYFVAGPAQATPGKKFCRIQVVMTGDSKPDLRQSALRALIPGAYMLMLSLGGLLSDAGWLLSTADSILLLASAQRLSLHDRLARTRVVKR